MARLTKRPGRGDHLVLGAMALAGAMASTVSAQWSVVNLRPLGSEPTSVGYGVQGGQQVGYAELSGYYHAHAGLWTGTAASWVDLNPAGSIQSFAKGTYGGKQVGVSFLDGVGHASLWAGSAASWVDLSPAGATDSGAYSVYGGQQVGYAIVGGRVHASRWSGTADSWVDLNPVGAEGSYAYGVYGSQQAGHVVMGSGDRHASLWSGTADSWVDLGPAGTTNSVAFGFSGGQQVGQVQVGEVIRVSLWTGTAASWVDLSPAGASGSRALGVYGGQQVGDSFVGGTARAILWSGSAASWVDLHALLPARFGTSTALGVWNDGSFTYVVGQGTDRTTGVAEAMMWVGPVPSPSAAFALGAGLIPVLRRGRR